VARAFLSVLLLQLVAGAVADAQTQGAVRLTVGGGADSNASRDYLEVGAQGDAMALVLVSLQGRWWTERFSVSGTYDGGARKFFLLPSEDVLVQAASADLGFKLGGPWALGLELRAKDRRGTDRSYSDLWGSLYLSLSPDAQLDLRLYAAAHRFLYWPSFGYAYGAPELGGSARYRFNALHSLLTFAEHGARRYMQEARVRCDVTLPGSCTRIGQRQDSAWVAGVGYNFRGSFTFGATYSFFGQDSNSFGETQLRHRVLLTGGFRLFFKSMLFAQVSLNLTQFPDNVFLSPDLSLLEDDETTNSGSLRWVRPLSQHLDVEVRYALYQALFLRSGPNGLSYLRHVGWVGLTYRP